MNTNTYQKMDYLRIKEQLMQYAVTYTGKALVEKLEPSVLPAQIVRWLAETEEALNVVQNSSSIPIPSMEGMEGVFGLLGKGYVLTCEDLSAVAQFIKSCNQWRSFIQRKEALAPSLAAYAASMYDVSSVLVEIDRCIEHGQIKDQASADLWKIRKRIRTLEERIKRRLDAILQKHKSILQELMVSKRSGRYVIPVKKEFRKKMQGTVWDESSSGQTVFIEPAELTSFQQELSSLHAEEYVEEQKVMSALTEEVDRYRPQLELNGEATGQFDFIFAKAKYAATMDGRSVQIRDDGEIHLRGAVHPLLSGERVPLDLSLGKAYRALIITGPNTGGKTVALKTLGLLTLMAQSGLLVPVKESSGISVFQRLEVDIGDNQSMDQSLSTFSSHIRNIIQMLRSADHRTLILIDEMASGTDPGEGIGLSIAVLEELYRKGATIVATTHYNEIKNFASQADGFENARMEFDLETLRPLYTLTVGEAGQSYAFYIAQKLGIDGRVIERAKEITSAAGSEAKVSLPKPNTETGKHQSRGGAASVKKQKPSRPQRMEGGEVHSYEVGDVVWIPSLKRAGVIYQTADERGEVTLKIQNEKVKINQKRIKPYIDRKHLYPEAYDMDIVFESKETRKKRNLMKRKHVEGLQIEHPAQEDEK